VELDFHKIPFKFFVDANERLFRILIVNLLTEAFCHVGAGKISISIDNTVAKGKYTGPGNNLYRISVQFTGHRCKTTAYRKGMSHHMTYPALLKSLNTGDALGMNVMQYLVREMMDTDMEVKFIDASTASKKMKKYRRQQHKSAPGQPVQHGPSAIMEEASTVLAFVTHLKTNYRSFARETTPSISNPGLYTDKIVGRYALVVDADYKNLALLKSRLLMMGFHVFGGSSIYTAFPLTTVAADGTTTTDDSGGGGGGGGIPHDDSTVSLLGGSPSSSPSSLGQRPHDSPDAQFDEWIHKVHAQSFPELIVFGASSLTEPTACDGTSDGTGDGTSNAGSGARGRAHTSPNPRQRSTIGGGGNMSSTRGSSPRQLNSMDELISNAQQHPGSAAATAARDATAEQQHAGGSRYADVSIVQRLRQHGCHCIVAVCSETPITKGGAAYFDQGLPALSLPLPSSSSSSSSSSSLAAASSSSSSSSSSS
jgi:hypothetical protein